MKTYRTWHRWLALTIGIQILLWMISGAYFSWVDIDNVRGALEANRRHTTLADSPYAPLGPIIAQSELGSIDRIDVRHIDGGIWYLLRDTGSGDRERYSAATGAAHFPLEEGEALRIAKDDFNGEGDATDIAYFTESPGSEYRGPLPVYRVIFDNTKNTRLYVDAHTGEITARRNTLWRIFDWLWMLHIMDYDTRDNFNNPLLRGVSVAGIGVVLSGALVYFVGLTRRRQNRRKLDQR